MYFRKFYREVFLLLDVSVRIEAIMENMQSQHGFSDSFKIGFKFVDLTV